MVRAEDIASRIKLINIIKGTVEIAYLRLLLDYHGLQLMWSWMVEAEDNELKSGILEVLEILPIPNKTMLTDSKVYSMVERWSQQTEEDSQKTRENDETVSQSDTQNIDKTVIELKDTNIDTKETHLEVKANQSVSDITPEVAQNADQVSMDVKQEVKLEPEEELMDVSDEVPTTTQTDDEPKLVDKSQEPKAISQEVEPQENEPPKVEKEEPTEKINKSSPRVEVRSSSLSLVIKPRSVPNTPPKEVQTLPIVNLSKPSIAMMAQKLLLNWKELKEVFRIPRLERQKRYEDEKEADRKTKEVEERRARGLPVVMDKRGVDDRDYTIAGILGIKRKGLKRSNDLKDSSNKRASNPLSQPLSSNWNKVSKEEHRKMFEMEVAQKDYQEALKRYHQELAYYNAMYGQQIQAQQQLYTQPAVAGDQQYAYDSYYQSQNYAHTYDNYTSANGTIGLYLNTEDEEPVESLEESNMIEEKAIFSTEPAPALITLTDSDLSTQPESTLAIDSAPIDCVEYSDSVKPKEPSNDTIFDVIYPPPGVFYETLDGQKFFTPLPIDRNQKAVDLVFTSNVSFPLEEGFSQSLTTGKLPHNWAHSCDSKNNVYYYHKLRRKSQWNPPEEEKIVSPIVESLVSADIETKMADNEDSMPTSEAELICKSTPSKADEESRPIEAIDDTIEASVESIIADRITANMESEAPINSTHSPTNLLQSLLALEADPRKRRHLLNAVMPSTTTAAADTSSSSNRRKLSTRQIQEQFRNKMSEYVVHCLNPYRRPDCKKGRILNNNDFKFLARKV